MINREIEECYNYSVKANVLFKIKNSNIIYLVNLSLYNYQNVNNVIKDLINKNNINIGDKYYLFLERNNKIIKEINKEESVDETGIEENDTIIITKDKNIENEDKQIIIIRNPEEELKDYNNEKISLKSKKNKTRKNK